MTTLILLKKPETKTTLKPNAYMITQLEELLEMAKSGHLVELAGVAMLSDRTHVDFDSGAGASVYAMYGALSAKAEAYREDYVER